MINDVDFVSRRATGKSPLTSTSTSTGTGVRVTGLCRQTRQEFLCDHEALALLSTSEREFLQDCRILVPEEFELTKGFDHLPPDFTFGNFIELLDESLIHTEPEFGCVVWNAKKVTNMRFLATIALPLLKRRGGGAFMQAINVLYDDAHYHTLICCSATMEKSTDTVNSLVRLAGRTSREVDLTNPVMHEGVTRLVLSVETLRGIAECNLRFNLSQFTINRDQQMALQGFTGHLGLSTCELEEGGMPLALSFRSLSSFTSMQSLGSYGCDFPFDDEASQSVFDIVASRRENMQELAITWGTLLPILQSQELRGGLLRAMPRCTKVNFSGNKIGSGTAGKDILRVFVESPSIHHLDLTSTGIPIPELERARRDRVFKDLDGAKHDARFVQMYVALAFGMASSKLYYGDQLLEAPVWESDGQGEYYYRRFVALFDKQQF